MKKQLFLPVILSGMLLFACRALAAKPSMVSNKCRQHAQEAFEDSTVVYQSENLIILQLSAYVYQHISFLQTQDFGKVNCNGMIAVSGNEAVVFDSPTNDDSAGELINFFTKKRGYTIKAVIPTHFHEDCVGGLEAFNKQHIPVYASTVTLQLLKDKGRQFSLPIKGFTGSLSLKIGKRKVYVKYFGEGHTKDSVVGYYPDENAVFGGCLVKEMGAGKGFLGDANTAAWPQTVRRLKQAYPAVRIVIPGHGKSGGAELLDYTAQLFK